MKTNWTHQLVLNMADFGLQLLQMRRVYRGMFWVIQISFQLTLSGGGGQVHI